MKDKIKNFGSILLKFILFYPVVIIGAATIYIHINFNMISFDVVLSTLKDVFSIDWAVKQIKIYSTILFFVAFFIVWFFKTKHLIVLFVLLLLLPIFTFDIFSYFKYKYTFSDFYEENYVKPIIKNEKKNNLIIVYLESFEDHLATHEISPFLAKQKETNISFRGYNQITSTQATIFAHFASMCGTALNQHSDNITDFRSDLDCIPDLLKKHGYNTAYIKAADITFSRANYFAKQHGFDVIKGVDQLREQASKITKNYLGNRFGGLRDKVLFEVAKEEISNLKEPFFTSITTLDMHKNPAFYYDPECEKKFGDIRDIAACTSKSLENFVAWLKKQPFWENTTLVILGDHKLPVIFQSQSQPINILINSKVKPENLNRKFTTYDYAPTIMEAIGYDVDKFGIGRSLFAKDETLFEKNGSKFSLMLLSRKSSIKKISDSDIGDIAYNNYKLGTILNNQSLNKKHSDFGDTNPWCNKTVYSSMTLDKLPDNGVYLKMRYLKSTESFSLKINDKTVYETEERKVPGFMEENISVHLPKTLFNEDKKLLLKVVWPHNNMNIVFGLCIKELVISEKE